MNRRRLAPDAAELLQAILDHEIAERPRLHCRVVNATTTSAKTESAAVPVKRRRS